MKRARSEEVHTGNYEVGIFCKNLEVQSTLHADEMRPKSFNFLT